MKSTLNIKHTRYVTFVCVGFFFKLNNTSVVLFRAFPRWGIVVHSFSLQKYLLFDVRVKSMTMSFVGDLMIR